MLKGATSCGFKRFSCCFVLPPKMAEISRRNEPIGHIFVKRNHQQGGKGGKGGVGNFLERNLSEAPNKVRTKPWLLDVFWERERPWKNT